MNKSKEVYDAVQAALLNSECSPDEAVNAALRAVAEFADMECEATEAKLQEALRKAMAERDA